jgi:hypothetical protein
MLLQPAALLYIPIDPPAACLLLEQGLDPSELELK